LVNSFVKYAIISIRLCEEILHGSRRCAGNDRGTRLIVGVGARAIANLGFGSGLFLAGSEE
jgi:hypothetical protein